MMLLCDDVLDDILRTRLRTLGCSETRFTVEEGD